ncbi:hypothetical protein [Reichenbachiella ulvae]|uniref:AhpC/TSA family protein n=1 Tax=Reichenbachiella ulvae TaxID=2980104 RepID=A0ABT3CTF9_9BACT|nr:hypothetical protein [Reichenbachiella ulvae]MCV9386760.1 hypothetical protein [Reichenbachiella ulvae]
MRKRKSLKHLLQLGVMNILLGGILYIFWIEDFQYLMPNKEVNASEWVAPEMLSQWEIELNRPAYFHFYDPNCKFSKVNLKHLQGVFEPFQGKVDFFLILLDEDKNTIQSQRLLQELSHDLSARIIYDPNAEFSQLLGVNAFPNALILDTDGRRYFQGNYTQGMSFCGSDNIDQSAPLIALEFQCKNNPPPLFPRINGYQCAIN